MLFILGRHSLLKSSVSLNKATQDDFKPESFLYLKMKFYSGRNFFLILCFLVCVTDLITGCGHRKILRFGQPEVYIGKITDNSNIYFTLRLINEGDQTVFIKKIKSSLSNVALQYRPDSVTPGDTVVIGMILVGNGLEGNFSVKVDAEISGHEQPESVYIKGYVEKTLPTVSERCQIPFGLLRIDRKEVKFGSVLLGETYRDTLMVYNPTAEFLTVSDARLQENVGAHLVDDYVRPGKMAFLVVELKVEDMKMLGKFYQNVLLFTGHERENRGILTVEADIGENFESLSQQELQEAPEVEIDNRKFDFGTVKAGTDVSHSYVLKNNGKRSLIIRKIQTSCGCTAVVPGQRVVSPGQTVTLDAVFHSAGRNGTQQKSILVFTNDPQAPEIKLWLTGRVLGD